jgi:hypothetical protein
VVGDTNTTYYTIAAQTGTEWEVGIGTYTLSGTTLSRTTVLSSSNSGSPVNFSAGTKDVFVTYPSSRSIYADGTTLKATNSSILPVISGGTGVTTSTGTTNVVLSNSPTLVTPEITTSVTTASTTFALLNTTATTLNFGGAATTLNLGAATGTMTVANTTFAAKAITASTTLGVTGVSTFAAGTAALPGLTTTGDTNTGIYFPAADTVGFTTGGSERVRIDSTGNVGISEAAIAGTILYIPKQQTGATSATTISARMNPAVDVTATSTGYTTFAINGVGTSTTTFTHYNANQGTFSGTAPTNQNGFNVSSALTGATNNYGFVSNIASGTNRFNFYAAGTAANYFAGSVGIGQVPVAQTSLFVIKTLTGSTTAYSIYSSPTNAADVTANVVSYLSFPATANAVTQVAHYRAGQGTFTGAVTNQFGVEAQSTLTGATNNYGVYSNIAAAANRWNFYANGTARNYMAADLTVNGATAIPAGGTAGAGLMVSTTANFGVFFGSGAPTLSAAKGSLYLRSDGSTVNDRMYVNTNGSTTWTNVVTSA